MVAAHADRLALSIMTSPPPGATIGAECLNRLTAYALGPQKYEALFGIVNLGESDDRAIRRAYWAFNDKAGNRRLSFAARMVEAGVSRREPLNETDPFWIDYSVRPGGLPSVSWNDVSARLAASPDTFRSKLIIIGATFTASGDAHRIPGPHERGLVAGEYVQALIANTILAGYPIHAIRLLPCLIVTGIFCLASTIGALWFPHRYGISLSASILTFAGYGLGAFLLFRETRTLIPVVGPELLILMALLAGLCFKLGLTQYPTAKS